MTDRHVNKRLFGQIHEQANEQSIKEQRDFQRNKQLVTCRKFHFKNYVTITSHKNHLLRNKTLTFASKIKS